MSAPSLTNRIFFVVQGLLKYLPFGWAVRARRLLYRPFFRKFGRGVIIMDNITIKYPDQIDVGDHVRINEGCYVVGLGGLSIGEYTMIGAGSKIVTTSHVHDRTDVPMALQGLDIASIEIGDDVWIGFDTKVLAGTVIGRGSIIGAGAVIAGNRIPPLSVAAGTPARVLSTRADKRVAKSMPTSGA